MKRFTAPVALLLVFLLCVGFVGVSALAEVNTAQDADNASNSYPMNMTAEEWDMVITNVKTFIEDSNAVDYVDIRYVVMPDSDPYIYGGLYYNKDAMADAKEGGESRLAELFVGIININYSILVEGVTPKLEEGVSYGKLSDNYDIVVSVASLGSGLPIRTYCAYKGEYGLVDLGELNKGTEGAPATTEANSTQSAGNATPPVVNTVKKTPKDLTDEEWTQVFDEADRLLKSTSMVSAIFDERETPSVLPVADCFYAVNENNMDRITCKFMFESEIDMTDDELGNLTMIYVIVLNSVFHHIILGESHNALDKESFGQLSENCDIFVSFMIDGTKNKYIELYRCYYAPRGERMLIDATSSMNETMSYMH